MSKKATTDVIPGVAALSVGLPDTPAPPGWRWVRLTDVARLESGHTPSRKRPEYWNGDVAWLTLPDARAHHGRVITKTSQTISESGLANSAARLLPADTVCLSRTASVGNVTRLGRPMATSQDFVNWVCSPELDPRFLQYAILAEGDHLLEFGKGTTHTTIYFPAVLAFHICMPPRAEQERIVERVEALLADVSAARGRLTRVREVLKRFRQSVLAAACAGRLTEEWRGRLGGPAATGPDDEPDMDGLPELPDIPSAWAMVTLDAITRDVQYGASVKASDDPAGVPILRMGNIKNGSLDLNDLKYVRQSEASKLQSFLTEPGDVLFNRTNSPELVGKTAVVGESRPSRPMLFASYLLRVRPRQDAALPEYLSFWLNSPWGKSWARVVRTDGVSQSNINAAKLKRMPVPLPTLAEQQAIVDRVGQLLAGSAALEAPLTTAEDRTAKLERAILEKALSGELVEASPAHL